MTTLENYSNQNTFKKKSEANEDYCSKYTNILSTNIISSFPLLTQGIPPSE